MKVFSRRRRDGPGEPGDVTGPDRQPALREDIDYVVADLLVVPEVKEAISRAPKTCRSCVDFDYDDGVDPFGFYDECVELMQHVWLSSYANHLDELTFEIGLGDEIGAYTDLRADIDPVSEFLRAHPDIDGSTVEHDNSERFTFTPSRQLDASAFAVLTVDALAAGHVATLRAAGLG